GGGCPARVRRRAARAGACAPADAGRGQHRRAGAACLRADRAALPGGPRDAARRLRRATLAAAGAPERGDGVPRLLTGAGAGAARPWPAGRGAGGAVTLDTMTPETELHVTIHRIASLRGAFALVLVV